jgi:hypothetical protein
MQDLQTGKRALEDTLVLLIFSVVAAFMISVLGICLSAHATPPDASAKNAIPVRMSDGTNYNDVSHPLYTSPAPGAGASDVNLIKVGGSSVGVTVPVPVRSTNGTSYESSTNGGYTNLLQGNAVLAATNPISIRVSVDGTNYLDATHGMYNNLLQGNAVISATNGIYSNLLQGNAVLAATNPIPTRQSVDGTNYNDATHGSYTNSLQGNAVLSATNGLYTNLLNGNAVLAATNPIAIRVSVDGTNYLDATHGLYNNLLQGNAVISATNGIYSNLLQGNAALSVTNGIYTNLLQGNAVVSATNTLPIRVSADGTNPVDATHGIYTNLLQGNAVVSNSNPIPTFTGSTTTANMSHVTADLVATTSTAITGLSAARNLTVINGDATAIIYVDPNSGTASTSNGLRLGPGQGHTWSGMKDTITGFTYYSTASSTKTLTYTTW